MTTTTLPRGITVLLDAYDALRDDTAQLIREQHQTDLTSERWWELEAEINGNTSEAVDLEVDLKQAMDAAGLIEFEHNGWRARARPGSTYADMKRIAHVGKRGEA